MAKWFDMLEAQAEYYSAHVRAHERERAEEGWREAGVL